MWIADSYAKINFGLNVLEQLSTGKHNIETGLCFIDWRDRFEVKEADKMKIEISGDTTDGDNINRAIKVLNRYVGLKNNYHFNIEKRIPSDSGLGGESSNAALTLRMLNKIEGLGLSDSDLIDISRDMGANISFFIKGETGVNHGIDREFETLNIQPDCWIVTCFPNETSNSGTVYGQIEPNIIADYKLKKALTDEPIDEWRYLLFNDFEQSVFQHIPVSGNLKDQFYEFGAVYASMAGMGSAVYGLFEQNFVAVDAYKTLINLGYPANLTKPGFSPDYGIYRKG